MGYLTKTGEKKFWNIDAVKLSDTLFLGFAKDITERKLAEEKLKESESRFYRISSNANEVIFKINIQKHSYELITENVVNILGYSARDFYINPALGKQIICEDDVIRVELLWKNMLKYGISQQFECRMIHKSGKTVWLHQNNVIVKDDEGVIIAIEGSFCDITERKRAESALRASEIENQSLLDNSPVCTKIVDLDFNLQYMSAAGVKALKIDDITKLYGKPYPVSFYPAPFNTLMAKNFEKVKETGEIIKLDAPIFDANGNILWYQTTFVPVYDNKKQLDYIMVVSLETTERKRAEEKLIESERTLRQIIDLVPLFVLAKDRSGKYLIANKAVAEIYGTTVENIIGKSDFDFTSNKEEAEKFIKDDLEVIESGQQKDIPEEQITDSQGNLRYLQTTKIPFKTTLSKTPAILAVAVDITARKKTENYLQAALDKAEESDRLKSAFLTNMSHEIRTPMNGILGFVDLLDTPGLDDTKKHEFKKIINKSSDRLLDTINALIDISRIEANQTKILNTEVCINKLLDELHMFFNPEASSKGLSLTFLPALDRFQSTIFVDNHKLNGVLINLIKNAIKYTDAGSITFGYILKDAFIEFFVEDTGIGVPEARQEAIFDRFIQADSGNSRAFEGLGLGLSISKAYVKAMGGEICLSSVEGKGSKFLFTIPHKSSSKKNIKLALDTEENICTKKIFTDLTILIAEDDDVISLYYKAILEDLFCKIIYAENGKEAIEIFNGNSEIDLILMDIKMPLMDGYTATREIRKFNKDVIIIAQTAYAFKGDREAALKAGCDEYMSKPIKREKLLEMIELLIERKLSP